MVAVLLPLVLGPAGSATAAVVGPPTGRPAAPTADDTSFVQNLLLEWDSFVARNAEPMGKLLLPFLGVLAVLLVVSRLIVFLVPRWRPLEDTVKVRTHLRRSAVIVGGICGLVLGSALLTFGLADVVTPPLSTAGTAVLLGVVVGAGVGALVMGAQLQRDIDRERRKDPDNESHRDRDRRGEHPRTPAAFMILGFALSAAAASGLVIRFSGTDTLPRWMDVWGVVVLGVPIAALGAGLTAWWLATRVRLDIKVNDASGTEQSSLSGVVAAYLNELGAEKPRGLEVPRGTDVTALDGAFATMPDNPVLKAIKSFVSGLAGVTPWAATIDQHGTCLAVSVRRNGRSEDSAVIDPSELLRLGTEQGAPAETASSSSKPASSKPASSKPASSTKDEASEKTTIDPTDAALKFAAAHILTTMAEHHPSIEQGLARATNWRSVGLHYIATTEPSLEESAKAQLLARALDLDHENLAARLAFRHAVDRTSVDPSVLDAYGQWLTTFLAELTDVETKHGLTLAGLRIRALYLRAAIASNATYAYAMTTGPKAEELERRRKAVAVASEELQNLRLPGGKDADPGPKELLDRAQEDARGLAYLVSACAREPSPQSVRGMYNLACTLASRNDVEWVDGARGQVTTDDADAVKLFERAGADPDNRQWMKKDPQLAEFRKRVPYRRAFLSDPRTDFFELSAVKPFADQLRQAGVTHVDLIRYALPHDLTLHLLASEAACSQIIDLAQLYTSLVELRVVHLDEAIALLDPELTLDERDVLVSHWSERPLKWWAVEILEELSTRGLVSPAAFDAIGAERKSVAEEIAKKLLETFKPETDTPELADAALPIHLRIWMAAVVQPVG